MPDPHHESDRHRAPRGCPRGLEPERHERSDRRDQLSERSIAWTELLLADGYAVLWPDGPATLSIRAMLGGQLAGVSPEFSLDLRNGQHLQRKVTLYAPLPGSSETPDLASNRPDMSSPADLSTSSPDLAEPPDVAP